VVRSDDELVAAIGAAKREGKSSFGDDRLIVEKYLERPRHVEVQVFADTHGNTVHLFERDCSAQRRHQKVLEEAPGPGIDAETRARLGKAAVDAAQAVGYVGAGTVEFIMDEAGSFHFMEMNTRLQVEHPVTELITGLDLVDLQLRVARGEPLPFVQDDLTITGHAVEVRLYAEDPSRDFLPQTGRLEHLHLPDSLPGIRIDSGVEQGGGVSIHYDPMIAKVIAHGPDRQAAFARLATALGETRVVGVTTNADFLKRLVEHPEVTAGAFDTGLIAREIEALCPPPDAPPSRILALIVFAELQAEAEAARCQAAATDDPHSPWARSDGWRLNDQAYQDLVLIDGETRILVRATPTPDGCRVSIADETLSVTGTLGANGMLDARVDGVRKAATVIPSGARRVAFAEGRSWTVILEDPFAVADETEEIGGALTAPMPAKVTAVHVDAGQAVTRGAPLVVLEAMKMEHTITAPADATVAAVSVAVGDLVEEGAVLVSLDLPDTDGASGS
jgi:3-methylcrotonyl-CoA carboxylase alpha subunit